MNHRLRVACLGAAVAALLAPLAAGAQAPYSIAWDDFREGFSATGPDAKWFFFGAGPYVGDDGLVTTGSQGLRVISTGVNPHTGLPAFVRTIGPDSVNGGLPGGLDHVKWLVYANHLASSGWPGFDAVPGQVVSCEGWIRGQTFGTEFHPFGAAVDNPNDDLRLAAFAMNSIDFETFMVFDFFITNETIYAFYERLPFGRGDVLGNYAAFSHAKAVAHRTPRDRHHLKTSYDRQAGTVTWYVDDEPVYQVSRLGFYDDRALLTLDHGGTETLVAPRQLDCGMGLFSLLDAYRPTNIGLVRLSDGPVGYFDPDLGEPAPQIFFDDQSLASNRIFGQGAELEMMKVVVSSRKRE